ncbi:hypothetical protein P7F88_25370 [Vibrio hannami]|uniref:hypothetical protein n=1 Tax=Vibrio hannami TaxID=2717094 RepID=UPI00240FCD32|nr:hypothetical protein [Vibrio hannami]MDG3089196.1 hypothetical protein [Vibrio hannami]
MLTSYLHGVREIECDGPRPLNNNAITLTFFREDGDFELTVFDLPIEEAELICLRFSGAPEPLYNEAAVRADERAKMIERLQKPVGTGPSNA